MSSDPAGNTSPRQPGPSTGTSPAEAPASNSGDAPPPMPELRAWLGALQVASLLAGVGFVAKLAHEQMLGIQLTDWSALDLSLFAGKWIVDTLTTSLDALAQSHYLGLLVILLTLIPALAMIFLPQYPRLLRWSRFLGVGLSGVGLCVAIVHYEMPTLALSDWLTADLTHLASPVHAGHRGSREGMVRYIYFMSKTDVADQAALGTMRDAIDAVSAPGAKPADKEAAYAKIADSLSNEAARLFGPYLQEHPVTAVQAQGEMNAWYSTVLWIVGVVLVTLVVFVVKGGRDLEDDILSALYYFTAFILLPVACTLLPYMYGKLICSSEFPQATIVLSSSPAEGKDMPGPGNPKGVLIAQGERGHTLLSVLDGATLIQVYTDPNIKLVITPDSNQDVVKYVLSNKAYAAMQAR